MGSAECGKRWTQLCVVLTLFVVVAVYTIAMRGKHNYHLSGQQWFTVGKNQSQSSRRLQSSGKEPLSHNITEELESDSRESHSITPEQSVNKPGISSIVPPVNSSSPNHPSTQAAPPATIATSTAPKLKSLSDMAPPKLSATFSPLTASGISELETFVLFVGYARSGHSIVGSLLDAHPDIVIAHEYNVLGGVKGGSLKSKSALLSLVNKLYKNSRESAVRGWRSEKRAQKGYMLGMSGVSWQGRVRRLRVVGDKAAGKAAREHMRDPKRCKELVRGFNGVAVKAIRVLRNPYDIIATRVLYNTLKMDQIASVRNNKTGTPIFKPTDIGRQTQRFLELTSQVHRMVTQCGLLVHDVHLVDLINQPRSVMRELCEVVQVECYSDYLDSCEDKVFKNLSKTRSLVQWSQKQIDTVAQKLVRYTEFSRYSFDCDC